MSRYFFDVDDGREFMTDDIGVDLPTLKAARDAAIAELPDVARDIHPDGDEHTFMVSVRDEAGHAVFKARLVLSSEWLDAR